MKAFVRHAVMLLAATATCQAGIAMAEEFRWASGGNQPATLVGEEKAAAPAQSPCGSCGPASCYEDSCGGTSCDSGCGSCCELGCDDCPAVGIVGFVGFDSFKGISDLDGSSNYGAVTGINGAAPLPILTDYGLDWQAGISYGVYDFDGRVTLLDAGRSQQQMFVTTGLFHKAKCDRRLSYGLVYDWMYNENWGLFGNSPTLGQWRGQVEYALSGCNAVGVYGSVRDLGARESLVLGQTRGVIENRAISQVNLFWHHKFCTGADSWLWVGLPERSRLDGDGSLGDCIVGANVQAPLGERLALYANGQYMHPSAAASAGASVEAGWDVGMGIVWYFGGNAISHAINGGCNTPYLPVANNSTFLVDQDAGVL
jgi:hypothetical protein